MKLVILFLFVLAVGCYLLYGYVKHIRAKVIGRNFFLHMQITIATLFIVLGGISTEIAYQCELLPFRFIGYGIFGGIFLIQVILANIIPIDFVAFCFYITQDRESEKKKMYRQYVKKTEDFIISSSAW